LQRAEELEPDDPGLRFNRAFAYQSCGRLAEALADLDTAALLAPDDADITAALAECRQASSPTDRLGLSFS
jgi:Flp pilus assembly protein TadD